MSIMLKRSAVPHLLAPSGPADVARFITTVVVDPVDACIRRLRPDMIEERLEVGEPLRAHGDPTSAVVGPALGVGVGAALLHAHPGRPFRTARLAVPGVRGPHAACALGGKLSTQAAAGLRAAAPEYPAVGHSDAPAVTPAPPQRVVTASPIGSPLDNQAPESLTRQVDQPHGFNLTTYVRTE